MESAEIQALERSLSGRICTFILNPGLEVIKLEFILRLKLKRNDWMLANTRPPAAYYCTLF